MSLQKDPEGLEAKTLRRFLDFQDKHVLEVGCGEGRLTFKYAASAKQVTAFDPDHDALRIARTDLATKLNARDESRGTYAHFLGASASHIPFSKETFDIAILAWSL
jgi:ubiquinone/menaquinone biosynthesis C-methylase UbiE